MIYPNAKYEIFVCDSYGNILAPFNIVDFNLFLEMSITRGVGEIGACYIRLSGGANSTAVLTFMSRFGLLRKDAILVIYRTIGNQRSLLLDTVFFIRSVEQFREATGSFVIKITAYDTNYLLSSRLTTAQKNNKPETTYKSETLSQTMYELVRDNIGSQSGIRQMTNFTESRELPTYGYTIEKYSTSDGMSFYYMNLLDALQQLNQLSTTPIEVNDPIYPVYFDVVAIDANSFVFQQFAQQRGVDRRFSSGTNRTALISDTMGQMTEVSFVADWQNEKTAAYSVFQNITGNAPVAPVRVQDIRRVANTPFSVREVVYNSSVKDVTASGNSFLKEPVNYPTFTAYAKLQDSPGFLYGIDWGYGDYITINIFGTFVDVRINAISFELTNKSETIKVSLQVTETFSF
jgi:hypothetical protein